MMPHFGNVGQMFGLEMYYVALTVHFLLSLAIGKQSKDLRVVGVFL